MKAFALALLSAGTYALPSNSGMWSRVLSLVEPYLGDSSISTSGPFAPVTSQILQSYIEPVNVWNMFTCTFEPITDRTSRSNSSAIVM